jgi:DNA invertase Pin-like site-specific DNA recombinase
VVCHRHRPVHMLAADKGWSIEGQGKRHPCVLSALAEDERARILARANGGRAVAKKRGVRFGPKPKLAAHQQREAMRLVREGQSLREVAHHYHVGHSTIVRVLERQGS